MNAARPLLITAAASLLVVGDYLRRQSSDGQGQGSEPDWSDEVNAMAAAARNAITGSSVALMTPSAELVRMLKRGEGMRTKRYRLGDGGWTIGYGRYYADGDAPPPESISEETAEAWFIEDIEARGARWVRTYVAVPLLQHEFDALVSMAFNLSPKSFRVIAGAVNAGQDPEAAALRYVRAGTHLEAGLRNRRAKEIQLYRTGVYT